MRYFSLCQALGFTAFTLSLGGCYTAGTYPDATEPDAAKLRFISDAGNTTLNVFDAQHCDGQTTGILNNFFVLNSRRRADMSIAPPSDAKPYLEIRLSPGKNLLLQAQMMPIGRMCGTVFNLTPQSGAEYEVAFDLRGNECHTQLRRLSQLQGQVVRSPIPVVHQGIPACVGANPLFPAPIKTLPVTPEREGFAEQIISQSIIPEMMPAAVPVSESARAHGVDLLLNQRKQQMNLDLPDAYWVQYRQNLAVFVDEEQGIKASALQLYKDEYRSRLYRLDTPAIRELVPDTNETDVTKALKLNSSMLQYYREIRDSLQRNSMASNWSRLAALDKQYGVCARYAQCWQN